MELILKQLFPEYLALREQGKCPFCQEPVTKDDFNDAISRKEYDISGLCAKCQRSYVGG
jgi:transcription initiation factor IIE alpha subunit